MQSRDILEPSRQFRDRLLHNPVLGMLSVGGLALAARLLGIGSRPIWYDEAFAILFAEKGPAAMVVGTLSPAGSAASDVHPLGYYSILWEWMRVFGESLVSVRALSVIAGVAVVTLIYLLARGLFGSGTALAAGVIAALAPFQVHYAQEIRMYVFLCLWLLLATYCYLQGSQSQRWTWWIGFAISAALAATTQYLAVFYLVPLAAWPLLTRNWRVLKIVILSACLSIVLCLPWLIHIPGQFAKVHEAYWIEKPGLYRFLTLALVFVTNLPLQGWQLAAGLFTALCLVSIALFQTLRAVRSRVPGYPAAVWLLYLAFGPPILLFLVSQWIPVYLERALLPSGAIFCIWLAWSITETRPPVSIAGLSVMLLAGGFSLGLYQHVTNTSFPYAAFGPLVQNLQSNREAGDAIIHSNKLSMLPAVYFDRTLPETYLADPPGSAVDTLAPRTQQVLGIESMPDIESAAGNARRVWYILFDESNEEYIQAGYPRHPDLTWLMQGYQLLGVSHWGDLSVYLFSRAQ